MTETHAVRAPQEKLRTLVEKFYLGLIVSVCALANAPVAANPVDFTQDIRSGDSQWKVSYGLEIGEREITVSINISLLVPKSINRAVLQARKDRWQQAINSTWNNRFFALTGSDRIPIFFNIRFTHFEPHHRVIIHPGNWIPNQHNWYQDTPPATVAHEIGHMLGAFDEYYGGARSPKAPVIDTSSIMGGNPAQGFAYPRHLSLLQKMLAEQLGDEQVTLVTE